jgi:hypothetical protein
VQHVIHACVHVCMYVHVHVCTHTYISSVVCMTNFILYIRTSDLLLRYTYEWDHYVYGREGCDPAMVLSCTSYVCMHAVVEIYE